MNIQGMVPMLARMRSVSPAQRALERAMRPLHLSCACRSTQEAEQKTPKRPRKFESCIEIPETYTKESVFTEEHVALRKTLRKIIEEEINPHCDAWEEAQAFPAHEVFKILGNAGMLGITKPEEYGGLGLDFSYAIAMSEEMGRLDSGGVSMAIGVHSDMCTPGLSKFGSDELRESYLRPSIAGDLVGCLGVSEPGAGSDVASLKTFAKKRGDDYVINGGKMWTTSGMQADWMCLLANTSEGDVHTNKSLIVLPMDTPGVTRTKIPNKMGMRSSDTAQVFFEDVVVPQTNRIGEEGMGFIYQMLQFQDERLWGAANSLLGMDRAVHETANYCYQREAFGQPILDNQVVHFKLAELATEIELLRSIIYRATEQYVGGEDVTRLATMAKLKAGRLCREVADSCLQFWGGMGYTDIWIGRFMRDVRLLSIGAGADEVMLQILCKDMDTLPKGPGNIFSKRPKS